MRIAAVTPAATLHASEAQAPVREVAPQRTVVSASDIRGAIARAHQRVTGRAAPPALLDALTAQACLETARGASMYNYNFGGIKGAGPDGTTASLMTHEVLGGHDVRLAQGFRAYSSLEQGADDYVRLMVTRFHDALPAAARGDLGAFAHALKQAHYYTADEHEYAAALRSNAGAPAVAPRPSALASSTPDSFVGADALSRITNVLSTSVARIAGDDDRASDT